VRRRHEDKGRAAGIPIGDDFAHHPTAVRATVEAARARWPGRRIWAAFEPRSNTMRRKVFEPELAEALAGADGVVLGPVNRPHLLSDEERLSPERVAREVRERGRPARAFGSALQVLGYLICLLQPPDILSPLSHAT